jgi:hypothetical protein
MSDSVEIAFRDELGTLGIKHLKRFWSTALATQGGCVSVRENEWLADKFLLDALGLGLQQTIQCLFQQTLGFSEFEDWIAATAGQPDRLAVERFNAAISGEPIPGPVYEWVCSIENGAPVLTEDDLSFWRDNGYVVVRDAVSPENRAAAEAAIWEYSGAISGQPETWYQAGDHGIMLELIQHPALQANRWAARIHKAFSQLWERADLWVSADRCGFHPPQHGDHPSPARIYTGMSISASR